MDRNRVRLIVALALCVSPASGRGGGDPLPRAAGATRMLDDREAAPQGWRFVGGEEFPGARGSLARDEGRSHGGTSSYRLDADFRGGGTYVGAWKDLRPLALSDVARFRLRVHARCVRRLGVRLLDDTGQCHQGNVALPPGAEDGWPELTLVVAGLVGGEHWGGAKDGAWHGPLGGSASTSAATHWPPAARLATLWIDDLDAVEVVPGVPKLRSCTMEPVACRLGYGTRIAYEWDAQPLGSDCSVFVHFLHAKGRMVFQADHAPSVPTIGWSGRVAYARTAVVPTDTPPGRYGMVVGLWDGRPADRGGGRPPFRVGDGLTALPGDACRVGTLIVSEDAPPPKLPPPSLYLKKWRLTFDEDFRGPLIVSAWGPGTRWIAHTPYAGDFADAAFADPQEGFPFTVRDCLLRIEAKKFGDRRRSGLLSSVDSRGEGFSQKFGYFEMRARFPRGPGTWPEFWLLGVPQLKEPRVRIPRSCPIDRRIRGRVRRCAADPATMLGTDSR